jgi:hypothetical protein
VAQGLPQPSGGRKENQDEEGRVVKVVEWFGYKHHLLVDVKHEVPLAYRVTDAKAGDNELVKGLVEQARATLPKGRIRTLAYDKAADDGNVTGARRCHAQVGVVMVVCMAFAALLAATRRKGGSMGDTRLGPIAQALREAAPEGKAAAGETGVGRGPGEGAAVPGPQQPDTS